MTTPPKPLSAESCHKLLKTGLLKPIISKLHEHTFEESDQSESFFNFQTFIEDFNRKSERRRELSLQLRVILEHTAKDASEFEVLDSLEAVRANTEQLYRQIEEGDPTEAKDVSDPRHTEFFDLIEFADDPKTQQTVELFGGVFVVLDHLRVHSRFFVEFKTSKLQQQFIYAFRILNNLLEQFPKPKHIQIFLGESRSFHELLVDTLKNAHGYYHGSLVKQCCELIANLQLGYFHVRPYMRDCGVIKCLVESLSNFKEPEAIYYGLLALANLVLDYRYILELLSINNSINKLIDILISRKRKDKKNAEWFNKQRLYSVSILEHLTSILWDVWIVGIPQQERIIENLLRTYKSRGLARILLIQLKLIDSVDLPLPTEPILKLLKYILDGSREQRSKFLESAKETVERFKRSRHSEISKTARTIRQMI